MKTFGIILLGAILSFQLSAQVSIPNAGFENWTGGTPDGWFVSPFPGTGTVTQSNTAHSGSSALQLNVVNYMGVTTLAPFLISGTSSSAEGFPYTSQPASLTGYYQFSPAAGSGDTLQITVSLYKNNASESAYAAGAVGIGASASSYIQFAVPIIYLEAVNPAVCVISFLVRGPMSGNQTTPHVGSYALIDDIELVGLNGVAKSESMQPLQCSLHQNYPNPFNPATMIEFTVPKNGKAVLRVYDMLGREVATLFNGEAKSGITQKVEFDAGNLPSGIYISKLQFANQFLAKKMLLVR